MLDCQGQSIPHVGRTSRTVCISNSATKAQLQSKLARGSYCGQPMQDYIDSFEEIFNRLAAMKSDIGEDLQVTIILASFRDNNKSPFEHVISSLQTIQEKLDWQTATASLLQEYEDQLLRPGGQRNLVLGMQVRH